jgi:hypothetical protein
MPIEVKVAFACETGVLDIVLASGCGGIVNHNVVCGLLTKCLQDVSSAIPTVSYLFARYWVFTFSRFCI